MNELQKIRKSCRYTRDELEKVSGVNKYTIKALESGRYEIENAKISTLIKLARALGCRVRDFFPDERNI